MNMLIGQICFSMVSQDIVGPATLHAYSPSLFSMSQTFNLKTALTSLQTRKQAQKNKSQQRADIFSVYCFLLTV